VVRRARDPGAGRHALRKLLSFNVASRYSDYDTFGKTTNNKISMEWRPGDTLLVRASAADGFRAPTIADLYGGGSQTFSFFTDPCDTNFGSSRDNAGTRANCVADMGAVANTYKQLGPGPGPGDSPNSQTPIAFTSGSNPLLQPETVEVPEHRCRCGARTSRRA
jgi:iron complex outermembrane receptor protein